MNTLQANGVYVLSRISVKCAPFRFAWILFFALHSSVFFEFSLFLSVFYFVSRLFACLVAWIRARTLIPKNQFKSNKDRMAYLQCVRAMCVCAACVFRMRVCQWICECSKCWLNTILLSSMCVYCMWVSVCVWFEYKLKRNWLVPFALFRCSLFSIPSSGLFSILPVVFA